MAAPTCTKAPKQSVPSQQPALNRSECIQFHGNRRLGPNTHNGSTKTAVVLVEPKDKNDVGVEHPGDLQAPKGSSKIEVFEI